jgi:hypothetical protein
VGHTHHGQQGQLLPLIRRIAAAAVLLALSGVGSGAQSKQTPITEAQASELTLTLTEVAVRPIQVWVRTAGAIDAPGRNITALVSARDGGQIKVGQRVRAFPPESRSSMFQARVIKVASRDASGIEVTAVLSGPSHQGSTHYVLEVVTEPVESLSVPNEAIIETDGKHVVYVQSDKGRYLPREIQPGLQGELYTQVLAGLTAGEQVVTFGSFFIDADHKLKGS